MFDPPQTDDQWARRSHPLAAFYRIVLAQPVVVLAVWSRGWFDWLWIFLTVAAVALWRLAPRMAPPAVERDRAWATLATRGERLWQEGDAATAESGRLLGRLSVIAGAAFGAALVGALALNRPVAVLAAAAGLFANLWLADRLAALYEGSRADG